MKSKEMTGNWKHFSSQVGLGCEEFTGESEWFTIDKFCTGCLEIISPGCSDAE
jgi:hypothetical protein